MKIQGVECITRQMNSGQCNHAACLAFDRAVDMLNSGKYNLGTAITVTRRTTTCASGYPAISYSALWHALVDAATSDTFGPLNKIGADEVKRALNAG